MESTVHGTAESDGGQKPARDSDVPRGREKLRTRDIVAEGLYIAAAATRLALKNRILVETISGGENFGIELFVPEARDTLVQLALEQDAEADRIRREQRAAWRRFDDSFGTHDYRSKDVGNLRRRRRQALRIAKELRARAEDDAALRELVEAARDAAWEEVSRNIDRTLRIEAARPDLEEDYAAMRDARMQTLMLVDLARLESRQKRRTKALRGELWGDSDDPEPTTAEMLAAATGSDESDSASDQPREERA